MQNACNELWFLNLPHFANIKFEEYASSKDSSLTCAVQRRVMVADCHEQRHLILVVQLGSHGPTVCVNGRKLRLF